MKKILSTSLLMAGFFCNQFTNAQDQLSGAKDFHPESADVTLSPKPFIMGEEPIADENNRTAATTGTGNATGVDHPYFSCPAPTGLSSSVLSDNSVLVSWAPASGAIRYNVEYRISNTSLWSTGAIGVTTSSVSLSGLGAGLTYDWRVRSICKDTSGYAQAQFTTTSACLAAFEPNETQATAANVLADVTYTAAITSAADVDYFKIVTATPGDLAFYLDGPNGPNYDLTIYNSAGTQIGSSTGFYAIETVNLYDQPAGTYYIKVNSPFGTSSSLCYNLSVSRSVNCRNIAFDVSTNGTMAGAAIIPIVPYNQNINGLISPAGDNDYYKFVTNGGFSAVLSLFSLPADYDLEVLDAQGIRLAISQNRGTANETINRGYPAGTYYIRVFGYNSANSGSRCYSLAWGPPPTGRSAEMTADNTADAKIKMDLFPNPAGQVLNVSVKGYNEQKVIEVFDLNGKKVLTENTIQSNARLNTGTLAAGIYLVKTSTPEGIVLGQDKFIKQ
jgi:hypothetical protein